VTGDLPSATAVNDRSLRRTRWAPATVLSSTVQIDFSDRFPRNVISNVLRMSKYRNKYVLESVRNKVRKEIEGSKSVRKEGSKKEGKKEEGRRKEGRKVVS
jgi:hypothetical protein